MTGFSRALRGLTKRDNHTAAFPAKAEIRQNVLRAVAEPRVFDGFAGSGRLHDSVWRDALTYIGCDLRFFPDRRTAYVADNRRVLRAIDLGAFNIFDLDAYGSPWEQMAIIAARRVVRSGEVVGICLTEGSGLKLKQGQAPTALAWMAGLSGRPAGVSRQQDTLIDAAITGAAKKMGAQVERRWEAKGKTGAMVRYIGLVLRGG